MRVAPYVGNERFMLTYWGWCRQRRSSKITHSTMRMEGATVTGWPPTLCAGLRQDERQVTRFEEAARRRRLINGGFFVMESQVLLSESDETVLEQERFVSSPPTTACAYRHQGFVAMIISGQKQLDAHSVHKPPGGTERA